MSLINKSMNYCLLTPILPLLGQATEELSRGWCGSRLKTTPYPAGGQPKLGLPILPIRPRERTSPVEAYREFDQRASVSIRG